MPYLKEPCLTGPKGESRADNKMEKPKSRIAATLTALIPVMSLGGCADPGASGGEDGRPLLVTVVCEYEGASAGEVGSAASGPIERALSTVSRVEKVSSASRSGQATIWAEFEPGTELYEARQSVAGRLQSVADSLPETARLTLAAASMGEVLLIALVPESVPETEAGRAERAGHLRELADTSLRYRLLTVPGASRVTVVGGLRKRYEVLASPERLARFDVTLLELADAVDKAGTGAPASAAHENGEVLVRGTGRLPTAQELAGTVIVDREDGPVRVEDVAEVKIGWTAGRDRVDAAEGNRDGARTRGVIVGVQLRPGTDGQSAAKKIDEVLQEFRRTLPAGASVQRNVDPRLNPLLKMAIREFGREFPPGLEFQLRSTEHLGDHLVAGKTDRTVVKLVGPDLDVLRDKADAAAARLREVPGVTDLQIAPQDDVPQWELEIDRERAARFGVAAAQLAKAVRIAIGERAVAGMHAGGRAPVEVVLRITGFGAGASLGRLHVRTQSGALVPLKELATVQRRSAPRVIYRENLQPVVFVSCRVSDGEMPEGRSAVRDALVPVRDSLERLDGDYRIEYGK